MSLPFNKDLTGMKVYLRPGATTFRLGMPGLISLILGSMKIPITEKSLFVFCSKDRKQLKLLYKEGAGVWLMQRKIHKGKFFWPDTVEDAASISYEGLQFLLKDPIPMEILRISGVADKIELYM